MKDPSEAAAVRSHIPRRIVLYLFGQFLMAMAASISIRSNLGVSPVSSVPFVLSEILKIEVGNMTAIVFTLYVVVQAVILRRDFHPIQCLQVVCAVLFGKFVTLTSALISSWNPGSYPERLAMTALATVLIAVGIRLYLAADLIPQSADGLVQTIALKTGMQVSTAKNLFDLASVMISVSASLLAAGTVRGVREGTLIIAVGVGRVMSLLERLDKGRLNAFVQGVSKDAR